tara:strand:- start:78 stop:578 length:501 start_codon:yes stop_codon:yes gene_type:complete
MALIIFNSKIEIHLITLRQAISRDLNTLKAFEQLLIKFEKTLTPTLKNSHINYYDLEAYIKNPEVSVVVAVENEELIASGYGLIQKNLPYKNPDKYILLGFMYVIPAFRGMGINKKVIEYLIEWGNSKGINEFKLDVYSQNTSAIKAYQKLGFSSELFNMRLNTDK